MSGAIGFYNDAVKSKALVQRRLASGERFEDGDFNDAGKYLLLLNPVGASALTAVETARGLYHVSKYAQQIFNDYMDKRYEASRRESDRLADLEARAHWQSVQPEMARIKAEQARQAAAFMAGVYSQENIGGDERENQKGRSQTESTGNFSPFMSSGGQIIMNPPQPVAPTYSDVPEQDIYNDSRDQQAHTPPRSEENYACGGVDYTTPDPQSCNDTMRGIETATPVEKFKCYNPNTGRTIFLIHMG